MWEVERKEARPVKEKKKKNNLAEGKSKLTSVRSTCQ